jgi:hypothetical protein
MKICIKSAPFVQDGLQAAPELRAGSVLLFAGTPSLRLALLLSLAAPMDITTNDFRTGQSGVVCRLVH